MSDSELLDLIIVGGGITGAGIARDAVLRGMKVALFEKDDYGAGTSSKSSKLVHGGLRYLEHGELGLVFESVSERQVQTKVAPHLVRPMPFLVPIYEQNRPGLELMNLGLWIYDMLSLFRAFKLHRTFRGSKALELEPKLCRDGLKGALEYYDCITDDARLVLENILDAAASGAVCRSYAEVVGLERDSERVRAVVVRDRFTGQEATYRTRAVVMAAGAWTDETNRKLAIDTNRSLLRRTKGVHLVFPQEKLPLQRAVTLLSPVDGRVLFAIPWRSRTVIGTTDTDFEGTADDVAADASDARYLCDSVNGYFPGAELRPEDIIATWAGLRPLINDEDAEDESDVSREHEIFVREDGITIIAGGKLTTYRRMAKQVVRKVIRWLDAHDESFSAAALHRSGTKKRPLPGAVGLRNRSPGGIAELAKSLASDYSLDYEPARHLARVYGTRAPLLAQAIAQEPPLGAALQPDLPYLWAEVSFACRHDLARTVEDVLARRVPLLLVGLDQGLDVLDRVADLMSVELGWTSEERGLQIAHYRAEVAKSRRFRQSATAAVRTA